MHVVQKYCFGFPRKLCLVNSKLMEAFAVNARVVGLLGPRSGLNGEHVEVLGFIAEPVARWRVRRRANGELLLLRSANLLNVVAQPALGQPCSTMEASSDFWAAGALPKVERFSEEKLPPAGEAAAERLVAEAKRLMAEVEADQAEEAAGAEEEAAEAERLATKVDETDETIYAQAQRPDAALPQPAVDGRMGGAKAISVTEASGVLAPARSPDKVDNVAEFGTTALRTPSSPPSTCMQPDHLATIPERTISPDRPSSLLKFPMPPQAYSMERATAQASGAHRASRSFQRISRERGRISERVGAERSAAQSMVYAAMERASKSVAASRTTSQSRDLAASTSQSRDLARNLAASTSQSRDLAASTSQSRDLTNAEASSSLIRCEASSSLIRYEASSSLIRDEASSSSSTSAVMGTASALIDARDSAHDGSAAPVGAASAVEMSYLTPSPKAVEKAVSPPSLSSQVHTQDEEETSSGTPMMFPQSPAAQVVAQVVAQVASKAEHIRGLSFAQAVLGPWRSPAMHLDASRCCRACGPCLGAVGEASRCFSMLLDRSCGPSLCAVGIRVLASPSNASDALCALLHTHRASV